MLVDELGERWGMVEVEVCYYCVVDIFFFDDLVIEVGFFEVLFDGCFVIGMWCGEILIVEGLFDCFLWLSYQMFVSGLDEIFGLVYWDGLFYVIQ